MNLALPQCHYDPKYKKLQKIVRLVLNPNSNMGLENLDSQIQSGFDKIYNTEIRVFGQ